MRVRPVIVLGVLLASLVAACGDDGDDSANLEPYVDAVAADIAASEDDSPPVSEEQARCAAERSVGAIDEGVITAFETPEDFVAATTDDLSALDLDDETFDTIADEIVDCFGGVDFILDALTDAGLNDEQVACVGDSLTEDDFAASIRADLTGEGSSPAFESQISACTEG